MIFDRLLLAQRDRWERLGDRFQSDRSIDWENVILWCALTAFFAIGVILLVRFSHRKEKKTRTHDSQELFAELCRAHGLSWKMRRLLLRLAKEQGLSQPVTLFLNPDPFVQDRLPETLRSRSRQLAKLQDRLFATN
ncbi:MAG: hypothetical protein JW829_03600 [Pirellulales bacterium]|nr:hypothetical protein [Pirellulales bacterium]